MIEIVYWRDRTADSSSYTVSRKGITVYNSIQSEGCIALMEQAAKEYTLTGTYNIFADAKKERPFHFRIINH